MTDSAEAETKCVSFPQFLSAILGIVTLFGGAMTFVWSEHAKHPHPGAVSESEMKQFEKRIERFIIMSDARDERVHRQLNEILRRLGK